MIPPSFEYAAPGSLDEAIELLAGSGEGGKLLAGGHSLIPLMKLRLAAPEILIDLGNIDGLAYLEERDGYLAVGPMTTHYAVSTSDLVRKRVPLLAEAAGVVGDMQVRNRGTLAGSLAHADPAGDLPAVALALGATVVARGPDGEREIHTDEFFEDVWTSALGPLEVITEVRVPYSDGRSAQVYEKFRQRASDWAIVGVAVNLQLDGNTVENARVTLVNVGPTPLRAHGVEEALRGADFGRGVLEQAAERAGEGLDPSPELRASPDYKRHLARVLTRRALDAALERAG